MRLQWSVNARIRENNEKAECLIVISLYQRNNDLMVHKNKAMMDNERSVTVMQERNVILHWRDNEKMKHGNNEARKKRDKKKMQCLKDKAPKHEEDKK
jgi:hypothetical protein